MISAVIVAAGAGKRMGADKLWLPLAGKPVAAHAIAAYERHPRVTEIILVVRPDTRAAFEELARTEAWTKIARFVDGGAERQDSVANGLRAVHPGAVLVAIHDAARPLVTAALIDAVADAALAHGAAVCGAPVTDTVKEVDAAGTVVRTPPRERLMAVQTPQIFRRALIIEAYRALAGSGEILTDDTAVAARAGHPVRVIACADPNPKITRPGDIEAAERLLAATSPG